MLIIYNICYVIKTFKTEISGFGKYPKAVCNISRPRDAVELTENLSNGRTVIPRGMGRSYGDASLNSNELVVESIHFNKFISFDNESGILKCESGISFKELTEIFIPLGWFPPVTPGTKYVTIGGAIASDVHGKNHHRDGGFSNFVKSFKIILADGNVVTCSREEKADLFWATIGGMGLTGFITEAEIQMKKISSPYISSMNIKPRNVDELFDKFDEYDNYTYSVAWIDIVSGGKNFGRNILMLGNHAEYEELPHELKNRNMYKKSDKKLNVPVDLPQFLLNKNSVQVFNTVYYRKTKTGFFFQYYDNYFYPLDSVLNWNRIYGKNGLVQYQLIVPPENARNTIKKILNTVVEYGGGSFLAVIKKMGDQDGILSFPFRGYTLSMDFPIKKGLSETCRELDRIVLECGGRLYLTKDSMLSEDTFKQMYDGKWQQWIEIKKKYDPEMKFKSDLGRRLALCQY